MLYYMFCKNWTKYLRRADGGWPGLAVLTIDIKLISSKRKPIFSSIKTDIICFQAKSNDMKKMSADMITSEANWKCSLEVMASRPLGQADVRVQYQLSLLKDHHHQQILGGKLKV